MGSVVTGFSEYDYFSLMSNIHIRVLLFLQSREPTFGGLEEADTGLDLGPVLVLLLRAVFHHQLVELHGDDVMVVWKTAAACQESGSRRVPDVLRGLLTPTRQVSCSR